METSIRQPHYGVRINLMKIFIRVSSAASTSRSVTYTFPLKERLESERGESQLFALVFIDLTFNTLQQSGRKFSLIPRRCV